MTAAESSGSVLLFHSSAESFLSPAPPPADGETLTLLIMYKQKIITLLTSTDRLYPSESLLHYAFIFNVIGCELFKTEFMYRILFQSTVYSSINLFQVEHH